MTAPTGMKRLCDGGLSLGISVAKAGYEQEAERWFSLEKGIAAPFAAWRFFVQKLDKEQ
jgi:hypothetical protein